MANDRKIAYLLQVHADPEHFGRLVRALGEGADFFVHVDRKSDAGLFRAAVPQQNVRFVEDSQRVDVRWGGFSQVRATLQIIALLQDEIRRTGECYKKVVLLSGSCYPIKSNAFILDFFDRHRGVDFMRATNLSDPANTSHNVRYAVDRYYFDFPVRGPFGRVLRYVWKAVVNNLCPRKPWITCRGRRLDIYHGSQWWALEQQTLLDLMQYRRELPCVERYLAPAWAPDEKYFHTLLWNSPHVASIATPGETAGLDDPGTFANLHIIDSSLQKWFTDADWDLVRHSDKLFVRKVSTMLSTPLLDRIDNELRT